jgi:N-(5-amino-5-carboxypentanoyl)-L-cysteinyl-D-valine synthase
MLNNGDHVDLCQSKRGLFDSLFVVADNEISGQELHFPLALILHEVEGTGSTLSIRYAGELFHDDTIDEFWSVMNILLIQIANNAMQLVSDLEYVSVQQKQQLYKWNHTDANYPSLKRLDHLFEEAVKRTLDKVAVVYGDLILTYRALDERANQLAHCLSSPSGIGIKSEELIELLLDKSELMIITALGVWKSGAAYVPIDLTYPDERVYVSTH